MSTRRLGFTLVLAGLAANALAISHPIRLPFVPRDSLSDKNKTQVAAIIDQMQRAAAHAAHSPLIQSDVQRVSRDAETIANPAMQRRRDRLLRFLGINPQGSTQLDIFVSWSMPLQMLRAYEVE